MSTNFYRAFEDIHRGSRDLIRERQEIYLPFINPLKSLYPQCPVLDLGCGRGEWLELTQSHGFLARGIDFDDGMLQACQALDLPAEHGDALAALAALDDESQVVVSAFHLIEHIPFASLQQLVREALRVLKPAGLLIMETPNPENLAVGTNYFYLDPTHEKPIPHLLLSFLTEYTGFARSKLVRLQESPELHDVPQLTLMEVLSGVSPDYAIIAQKAAGAEQLAAFDPYFARNYGLSLEALAERYEQHMERRFRATFEDTSLQQIERMQEIQNQVADVSAELQRQSVELSAELQRQSVELSAELQRQSVERALELQRQSVELEAVSQRQNVEQAAELQRQSAELEARMPHRIVELEAELQRQHAELDAELQQTRQQRDEALTKAHEIWLQSCADNSRVQAMMSSTSWRLTAPLRWFARAVRRVISGFTRLVKNGVRRIVLSGLRHTLGHPALRRRINNTLKRFPRLYETLKRFAYNRGLLVNASVPREEMPNSEVPQHLEGLSVGARQVYYDLKKTIEQKDLR
ncbi:class I SAM-dependent methyltransferase [Pseudomonas sp. GL-RE-29]|jgi:O-antigen chain-terminating methyltransferase|uniref:class I SAM-dependent methyltransferase n=1 Tax=Pseudomonas sp. GL-RE-29 TaxID=2832375 RepID=UPI001CBC41CB|nr:class I SAM-dependent methyltransferase [Pseudomonas sp. GL-RE-29]